MKRSTGICPVGLVIGFILFSLSFAKAQGTLQNITFDGVPHVAPGSNIGYNYYYENGMTFTPLATGVEQFTRAGGGVSYLPEDGTTYVILGLGDSISGTRGGTNHFGLYSVDLSEFSIIYQDSWTVLFVGYRADGSTVTNQFTTDGIIDGTGPLADFQTFYFDQNFSDIVKFEMPGYRYAMDNLTYFNDVPEPGAGTLFLTAALAFVFQRRIKVRRNRHKSTRLSFINTSL